MKQKTIQLYRVSAIDLSAAKGIDMHSAWEICARCCLCVLFLANVFLSTVLLFFFFFFWLVKSKMKLSVSAYRAHASAHKKILSSSYQQTLNYGSTAASSSTPATTLFSVSFWFQRMKFPLNPPFSLVLSYCFPLLILLLLPFRTFCALFMFISGAFTESNRSRAFTYPLQEADNNALALGTKFSMEICLCPSLACRWRRAKARR